MKTDQALKDFLKSFESISQLFLSVLNLKENENLTNFQNALIVKRLESFLNAIDKTTDQ
jgi:hypothetical protein